MHLSTCTLLETEVSLRDSQATDQRSLSVLEYFSLSYPDIVTVHATETAILLSGA